MIILTIIGFPFTEKVSDRFTLSPARYKGEKDSTGFLVKIARNMSRKLRQWLGVYGVHGKIEIKNLDRDVTVNGHLSRYKVIRPLDRGAMATIFEAEELNTGKRLVLKSLGGLQDKLVLRRFIREARILASIEHPNIVSAYDISEDIKIPFIAMEPLANLKNEKEPSNFKYLIKQFHTGEIDLRTMLYYISDISKALEYLHTHPQGTIIHRDLKPSNILFSREKTHDIGPERFTVKLVDFGLSRITGSSLTTLTDLQQMIGTPEYIPLQDMYNKEHEDRTEARLDVYSMGVIIYLIITGKMPFRASGNHSLRHEANNFPRGSPVNKGHKSDTPVNGATRTGASQIHLDDSQEAGENNSLTIDYESKIGSASSGKELMTLLDMHTNYNPDFSGVRDDIPSPLVRLTERMLAKHPDDRPHASEVVKEIHRIADADMGKHLYLPQAVLNQ